MRVPLWRKPSFPPGHKCRYCSQELRRHFLDLSGLNTSQILHDIERLYITNWNKTIWPTKWWTVSCSKFAQTGPQVVALCFLNIQNKSVGKDPLLPSYPIPVWTIRSPAEACLSWNPFPWRGLQINQTASCCSPQGSFNFFFIWLMFCPLGLCVTSGRLN